MNTVKIPEGFYFYKELIKTAAENASLDPYLVAAVVWQESAFNADAFRFEPQFWNRYLKLNPKYKHLNPRRVSSSYGLTQCMYCRVHEDKLTDNDALPPEHLFVPELNLRTGCQLLAELLRWSGGRVDSACAAYNGGRGGNKPTDVPLRNGKYAAEVAAKLAALRAANVY